MMGKYKTACSSLRKGQLDKMIDKIKDHHSHHPVEHKQILSCDCETWQMKVKPEYKKPPLYNSNNSGVPMYFGVKIDFCPFCGRKLLEDLEEQTMEITRHLPHWIKITGDETALHSGSIESQSVEANLLFEILEKLEEIRCGIIDVED